MFTGIIESVGEIAHIEQEGGNTHFTIRSTISDALKIDQSVSHSGVCLTVVEQQADWHRVTAIQETLRRSNLGKWKAGDAVNLERAMSMQARLDGHMVQGHVDAQARCQHIVDEDGSWLFTFEYLSQPEFLLVDKGSISINGVSLTVVEPTANSFSVAIIPYTYKHTTFHAIREGDPVNLEFDIIGKYIAAYMKHYQ